MSARTPSGDGRPGRPLLAVPHRRGALSAWSIGQAASGWCDLLWIEDDDSIADASEQRILRRFGTVVTVAGMSAAERADAVGGYAPHGIAVFSDDDLVGIAALADALGLRFHSPDTALRLADKSLQRGAFARQGLAGPQWWLVPGDEWSCAIEQISGIATFPAVLKPRRGANSRLTCSVRDAAELYDTVAGVVVEHPGMDLLLESYLSDADPALGEGFANYLSVESLVQDGVISHFALTGRFPTAEPFRETGFFIPSTVQGDARADVLALATDAISAVGIATGCVHTEIKLTAEGWRVIEVNGRLGGGIPAMLELVTGVSAVRLAMRVALGDRVDPGELPAPSAVAYRLLHQAPMQATKVTALEGLDEAGALDGVVAVTAHRGPGSAIDWRTGNHDYIYSVLGTVPDHDALRSVARTVAETVHVGYGT